MHHFFVVFELNASLELSNLSIYFLAYGSFNRPNRLTQCYTQFKSPRIKILCVIFVHTFKWYEIPEKQNVLFSKDLNWVQRWVKPFDSFKVNGGSIWILYEFDLKTRKILIRARMPVDHQLLCPVSMVFSGHVTSAILVSPINPPGLQLCSYANAFFCFSWKTCSLITCMSENILLLSINEYIKQLLKLP